MKRTIDKRMFCEIKSEGLWISHRDYKTTNGARALIEKLGRTHPLPYFIVCTRQCSYRPLPLGEGDRYHVAVKASELS